MPEAPWKKIDQNLQSADLHALKQHLRCMEYEKRRCDCLGGLPDPTSRNEMRCSCFVTNWILCSIFASGSYVFLAMLPACFLTASQGNVLLNRLGNATHPNTQIDEIVKTGWWLWKLWFCKSLTSLPVLLSFIFLRRSCMFSHASGHVVSPIRMLLCIFSPWTTPHYPSQFSQLS